MTERISRKDDEKLYQPKIHSQRIRELHQIVEQSGLTMTVLVDIALRKYVAEMVKLSLWKLLHPL
jgi:hypothetical protein